MGPDVPPRCSTCWPARCVAGPVREGSADPLYDAGARVFVEVGPKKALQGFAEDVLGDDEVLALSTNHPKVGDTAAFNQALCGALAAGIGVGREAQLGAARRRDARRREPAGGRRPRRAPDGQSSSPVPRASRSAATCSTTATSRASSGESLHRRRSRRHIRQEMLDKHITRLVEGEDGGSFETIDSPADVIKLAARAGEFDLGESSVSTPSASRPRRADPTRHRRRDRCAAGRRHPAGPALPDDERRPSSPIGGCSPTSSGTAPASSSPRPSPAHNDLADELTRFTIDCRRQELAALGGCGPRSPTRRGQPHAHGRDRPAHPRAAVGVEQEATRSTGASCSGSCRWGTRSSPS